MMKSAGQSWAVPPSQLRWYDLALILLNTSTTVNLFDVQEVHFSLFSVSWTFLRVPFLDSCKWSSEGLYHDINVLTFFFVMFIFIWVQASFSNMLFEKMAFSGSGGTSSFQLVHLQSLSVLDQISLFQLVRIQINFVWHPVLQLLK